MAADFWFYSASARGGETTDEGSWMNLAEYLDAIPTDEGTVRALKPGSWPDDPQLKEGVNVAYTYEVRMVGTPDPPPVTGLLWLLRVTLNYAELDAIDNPNATKPSESSKWAKWAVDNIAPQNVHMQQVKMVDEVETVVRDKPDFPVFPVSNKVVLIDKYLGDFFDPESLRWQ